MARCAIEGDRLLELGPDGAALRVLYTYAQGKIFVGNLAWNTDVDPRFEYPAALAPPLQLAHAAWIEGACGSTADVSRIPERPVTLGFVQIDTSW